MKQPFIRLPSGDFLLVDVDPKRILISDIAHSLSQLCRFTGSTPELYSVAQHSVFTSYLVPERYALSALLHDASEAYTGDLSAPLRTLLPGFSLVEKRIQRAIAAVWPVDFSAGMVRRADMDCLIAEAEDLLGIENVQEEWGVHGTAPAEFGPYSRPIECWSPLHAEITFFIRFGELAHGE